MKGFMLFAMMMATGVSASATTVDDYAQIFRTSMERRMVIDPTMKGKTCALEVSLSKDGFVTNLSKGSGDESVCMAGRAAILKVNKFPPLTTPELVESLSNFVVRVEPSI